MKFIFNLLLGLFCSSILFSNSVKSGLNGSEKAIKVGKIKFTYYYGKKFNNNDDVIERKRSHKRRRAVRKPRKGRSA